MKRKVFVPKILQGKMLAQNVVSTVDTATEIVELRTHVVANRRYQLELFMLMEDDGGNGCRFRVEFPTGAGGMIAVGMVSSIFGVSPVSIPANVGMTTPASLVFASFSVSIIPDASGPVRVIAHTDTLFGYSTVFAGTSIKLTQLL